MEPKVGVLALQGDFEEHREAIERAGGAAVQVRTRAEIESVDGLIIPGGESTTMLKLLGMENLFEPLQEFGATKPIFGTCAGAILLSKEVLNPTQKSLGLVDLTIERNGYGRQIDSRIVEIDLEGKPAEAVFIRAPIIRRVGSNAKVLARYLDAPVLVEQGQHLVATFHPELGSDDRIHRRFVEMVKSRKPASSGTSRDAVTEHRDGRSIT
ncbi:MAG: pyridoxal 5'-phosphate synthase glutaminase subunit PdxT [Acidobacteriaceae bacterium]|nr:pyridoxal 5'-phosphate synthase glutaminase subunit PdxT [Acidobacteriaceae bacterium]